ncbi:MAG: SHOCT domain-containing protein [Solirubrobacteraceae bacterium]
MRADLEPIHRAVREGPLAKMGLTKSYELMEAGLATEIAPTEAIRAWSYATVSRGPDGGKRQGAGVLIALPKRLLLATQHLKRPDPVFVSFTEADRFELRSGMMKGVFLRVQLASGQGSYDIGLVGATDALLKVIERGFAEGSSSAVLGTWGPYTVFQDRLDTPDGTFEISARTKASVDSAGNIAATRGRNLLAGGFGLVVAGPLGMLLGSARDHVTDGRELYLLVEDPKWAWGAPLPPDAGLAARQLAIAINSAAQALDESADSTSVALPVATPVDRLEKLKRLGELRDSGVLTDAEFSAEKARILAED